MLIAWRHPDTAPLHPYVEYRQCIDPTRPKGTVTIVDPVHYRCFVDGDEWLFAEKADGELVYVRASDCVTDDERGDHDQPSTSMSDGQEAVSF
jgi:hypothetical protein